MQLKPALAASILLLSQPALAVEGGVEDRVTTHAVAIATGGPTSPALRCSGTLIASNVVLTVRHCLSAAPREASRCEQTFSEPAGAPGDYWVNATPWAEPSSSSWRKVASWVVPERKEVCGNDVALLVLASPYLESEATPARPILDESDLRSVLAARAFGMAAFGATSAKGEGGGTRRSRFDIPIECVPGDPAFECEGALDYIDPSELTGGAGPCTGDSGGGAISRSDRSVIFGVLSRGATANGTCSSGVYERTDLWGWLIAKTVLEATPAERTPPAWAREAFPAAPRVTERCRGAGTCGPTAECVSLDGRRSFVCARRCAAGCEPGTHCESDVCTTDLPAPTSTDAGCAVAPGGETTSFVVAAVMLGALRALRRVANRSAFRRSSRRA